MIKLLAGLCFLGIAWAQTTPCGVPLVQPLTKSRWKGGRAGLLAMDSKFSSDVKTAGLELSGSLVLLVDDFGFISGSGALINEHVILTSAQHFEGPGYSVNPKYWRIYAGEHNISTTDPHEKHYRVARVILHPGYNMTSLENDIALVIVNSDSSGNGVIYNDHTRPACLSDSMHMYRVGNICYLPGWRSTKQTGNEEVLNQVDLPILADSVCQQHFPRYLPYTELCAGYENAHKDWCADDLGSPLMCKGSNNVWYIQGLASSGGSCTEANKPSVFVNVSQYTNWIIKQVVDVGFPYPYYVPSV